MASTSASPPCEIELFRAQGIQLYMIDGQDSVALQLGDFILQRGRHALWPLAAVVAAVGDLQWPVGKDSLVLSHGRGRFSFFLDGPRLVYGLSLPGVTDGCRLEGLLSQYANYDTFSASGEDQDEEQSQHLYWENVAGDLESKLLGYRLLPERGDTSARIHKLTQQARRVSAVTKLLMKTLVKNVLNMPAHVTRHEDNDVDIVYANVDAVTRVVAVVETAGRSLPDMPAPIAGTWTLNPAGVHFLFRAIATTSVTSSSSSSSSATGGDSRVSRSSSSSSDFGGLQSSSSSSTSSSPSPPRLSIIAALSQKPPVPVRSTSVPALRQPMAPPPPPPQPISRPGVYRPRVSFPPPPPPRGQPPR